MRDFSIELVWAKIQMAVATLGGGEPAEAEKDVSGGLL